MQKSNPSVPVHKHVVTTFVVLAVLCLFAFVIYPKMVLPAIVGGGGGRDRNISATPGDGQVALSWTELTVTIEGELIATVPAETYRIDYSAKGVSSDSVETPDSSTEYTVTGLTNDLAYTFVITGLASGFESAETRTVTSTPTAGVEAEPIAISTQPTVVVTSDTSVSIDWATSVEGTSVVEYGPTSDFKGEISAGAAKTTDHSIEITGLTSCAGYWFKVLSYDESSNLAESRGGEFKTSGCKGSSEIVTYQASRATTDAGTTVEAKVSGRGITAVVPANLKSGFTEVAVEALKLEKELVRGEISTPSAREWVGHAYSLKVFQDERSELEAEFDAPVEVTIDYTEEDIAGLDPNSLTIYHYTDGVGWEALTDCATDTRAMTVTCQTTSFSIFALFGTEQSSSGGQTLSSGSYVAPQPSTVAVTPTAEPVKVTATEPVITPSTDLPSLGAGTFKKNLARGQKDPEVKLLQMFLNQNGYPVALFGPGSSGRETEFFGPLTFAALIKFQEAYKNEILVPSGLTVGSGYFGPKTRALIESLK